MINKYLILKEETQKNIDQTNRKTFFSLYLQIEKTSRHYMRAILVTSHGYSYRLKRLLI
jgi:hypothetical protein